MNQRPATTNQTLRTKRDKRQSRFAKINATWKQLRPDLRGADELREARLEFAEQVLGCGPIGSFSDLTIPELDRVIAAMMKSAQASLPGDRGQVTGDRVTRGNFGLSPVTSNLSPSVVHLASKEEVWAIEQVLGYLGWTEEGRRGFFQKNFRRPSAHMLKPRQAKSAISILLSIAASKDIKKREGENTKVSRGMMRAEMPALKKRIGIDAAARARGSRIEDRESRIEGSTGNI